MNWWEDLVTGNPMLIEIQRSTRKFFGTNATQSAVAIIIILLIYIFLIGATVAYSLNYLITANFMMLLLVAVAPIMLHASIAGERERRSWDMLLVAPVSKAQIVAGKFFGAALAILILTAVLAVPLLASDYPDRDNLPTGITITFREASFALAVGAFTLMASAWSKRSIAALAIAYGSLFLGLMVFPILYSIANPISAESGFYFHPFFAISQVHTAPFHSMFQEHPSIERNSYVTFGLVQTIAYLLAALACLFIAVRTLSSAGWEDPSLARSK